MTIESKLRTIYYLDKVHHMIHPPDTLYDEHSTSCNLWRSLRDLPDVISTHNGHFIRLVTDWYHLDQNNTVTWIGHQLRDAHIVIRALHFVEINTEYMCDVSSLTNEEQTDLRGKLESIGAKL